METDFHILTTQSLGTTLVQPLTNLNSVEGPSLKIQLTEGCCCKDKKMTKEEQAQNSEFMNKAARAEKFFFVNEDPCCNYWKNQ